MDYYYEEFNKLIDDYMKQHDEIMSKLDRILKDDANEKEQ